MLGDILGLLCILITLGAVFGFCFEWFLEGYETGYYYKTRKSDGSPKDTE